MSNHSPGTVTTAVILAGGLGTRLRSEVSSVPKPMAPVAGRPFLEHLMSYWISQGIQTFILSVGYLHEKVCDYFGDFYQGASIKYVIEKKPRGTGGGLLLARDALPTKSKFLLLNGDTYFPVNLKELVKFSDTVDADWVLSLFRTSDLKRYTGITIDEDKRIITFDDNVLNPNKIANGGVYVVKPETLNFIKMMFPRGGSLEKDIFPFVLTLKQRIFGLTVEAPFVDIGIPLDYHRAASVIRP